MFVPWIAAIGRTDVAAATWKLKDAEPVAPVESVALTVTDDVPAVVGVPETTPAADIARLAGRPVAVHLYGAVPPVAVRVSGAMAVPAVAFWMPGFVTVTGAVPPPPPVSEAEFCGVGAATRKSAALLSVSVPAASRW